jgi:hypothetical protein
MAFVIEQRFDTIEHQYDRDRDVLYLSFGPPVPSVSLVVEDWLVLRMAPGAPQICGVTIIGFKKIFSKMRSDLVEKLPARVARIQKARFIANYSDETDVLTFRFEEEQPAYYERFESDVFLERTIVDKRIVGLKITHYTERGEGSVEKVLNAIIDALFAPSGSTLPADGLTRAFLEHLDLPRLLSIAA